MKKALRELIDHVKCADVQEPHPSNKIILRNLRDALDALERRAAADRGELKSYMIAQTRTHTIETLPVCAECGHIACSGDQH